MKGKSAVDRIAFRLPERIHVVEILGTAVDTLVVVPVQRLRFVEPTALL